MAACHPRHTDAHEANAWSAASVGSSPRSAAARYVWNIHTQSGSLSRSWLVGPPPSCCRVRRPPRRLSSVCVLAACTRVMALRSAVALAAGPQCGCTGTEIASASATARSTAALSSAAVAWRLRNAARIRSASSSESGSSSSALSADPMSGSCPLQSGPFHGVSAAAARLAVCPRRSTVCSVELITL